MHLPTVYLFDIDGTLISTAGAGRIAFERAFGEQAGAGKTLDFSFAGMTDRGIARKGLSTVGHDTSDESIDRLIEAYVAYLPETVAGAEDYTVFAGVEEILARVSQLEGVAVGLGTGNIERGARIKLERGGLNEHFDFGGFGCDAEERAELILAGARRGARRLQRSLDECRVLIIGDTPRDVAAAHAIGAECVGVATGSTSAADLEASGADYAFETLTDSGVMDALRGR